MAVVIPYVKQTWVDGSGGATPASAARLGVIEDGIFNASQNPAVRAFHNAAQATVSGTALTLAFNSERFDIAGGASSTQHDPVTNNSRLTCLYAGVYQITGMIEWSASPVTCLAEIRLNAATTIGKEIFLTGDHRSQLVTTAYALAVNDFVELRVTQTSGGALNVVVSGNTSPEFMMHRVG